MTPIVRTLIAAALGLVAGVGPAQGQTEQGRRQPPEPPPVREQAPAQDSPQTGTPRLELSTTEWDFGTKWYGEPCSTEVTIGNSGDGVLRITRIRSSCGCTVAQPKKRELGPGESVSMTISYNTKKDKAKVSQTITLETNDPQQQTVAIRIKGEVRQLFEATPAPRIVFGHIEREAAAVASIELRNNTEERVFLKLRPPTDAAFAVELEEIEPGMLYRLSATTKPPLKTGATTAEIVLETGLERMPQISIPVSAYIAPRVTITPTRLYVSPKLAQPSQRFVFVRYRSQQPVAIREIRSSHPDLVRAEVVSGTEGAEQKAIMLHHKIRVSLPAYADLPESGAVLEIYTDDPSPEFQKLTVEIERQKAAAARPQSKQKPAPPGEGADSAGDDAGDEPDEAGDDS